MKLLGFGLLLAGWAITVTAVALLGSEAVRTVFVLAGVGVEALGLGLTIRGHLDGRSERA
jgi:hypothetical protein